MSGPPGGPGEPGEEARALREAVERASRREGGPPAEVEALSLVAFRLSGSLYAIRITELDEIFPLRQITRVPFTPGHILGLLSDRGDVLPVADLRGLLGLPGGASGPGARILVARRGDVRLGILAEGPFEVLAIPRSRLEPPLSTMAAETLRYVQGSFPHEPGTVHLLELAPLFQPPGAARSPGS